MLPNKVILQQAVFGYRSGHNLLSASCELSSEARRTLAYLTDASGPWPVSGFDSIYTGIPLPDAKYYALFRTWPAPEMPRPGCVWSHVLLIELADLARLVDPGELRKLFVRPGLSEDVRTSEPLHFAPQRQQPFAVPPSCEKYVIRLLDGLYGSPKLPVIVEASDEDTYSDLIFAIWGQQWPRLRRNFRFSTGSFSDRSRGGVAFDIQVTPAGSTRTWQRNEKTMSVNEASLGVSDRNWIGTAANDLLHPDANNLRLFLHTYGADIGNPRAAFAGLAIAYELMSVKSPDGWTEKLQRIGSIFPNSSEAVRLKEWFLAPQEVYSERQNLQRAWAAASFLLTTHEAKAFAGVSFDHSGFAPMLWSEMRHDVLPLISKLVRQTETPSAKCFVTAIADVVRPSDLKAICEDRPELIIFFLRHRPALAFEIETWHLPQHIQWRVFETLSDLPLKSDDWGKVMAAMFVSATSVAVRDAVEKAGSNAIEGAFRWFDQPVAQEYLPSQIWREALASQAAIRLAEDHYLSPDRLALCAWLVPPRVVREILNLERDDIRSLANQPLDLLPPPLRVPTAFLLVMLGLRTNGREGLKLLARGFYTVHEALASSHYSSESWLLIAPELPRSPIWKEWDRCEKLRRAVRKRAKHRSEMMQLLEAAIYPKDVALARSLFKDEPEEPEFLD